MVESPLAIQCDQLIRDGMMKNQSELAHYAQITTARMTHIMWLTNLAPEIQEAILFLPRVESGPDRVKEIDLRRIARVMDWGVQRERCVICSPLRRAQYAETNSTGGLG